MKFPADQGIATVRGDQRGVRECYLNSIRKVDPRYINVVIMDMDMLDAPRGHGLEQDDVRTMDVPKEVFIHDVLDPHVIEPEPWTSLPQ